MNRRALLSGFLALPVALRFAPAPLRPDPEAIALFTEWRLLREGFGAMLDAHQRAAEENARQWYEAFAGEARPYPFTCDSFVVNERPETRVVPSLSWMRRFFE